MPAINKYDKELQDIADMIDHIVFMARHSKQIEQLSTLAHYAGYSETEFQKIFTKYVGLSPLLFRRQLDIKNAKSLLQKGHNTLDAAINSNFSGNSTLHNSFVKIEAMTPGEFANQGKGLEIYHSIIPTPFGRLNIARTSKGICHASFLNEPCPNNAQEIGSHEITKKYSNALIIKDNKQERLNLAYQIYQLWNSVHKHNKNAIHNLSKNPLKLHLEGTNFQIKVWQALLNIPCGNLTKYKDIAHAINQPNSSRAVGTAIGANPIAWIIPCHRVIKSSGDIHHYAWGAQRKRGLITLEQSTTKKS